MEENLEPESTSTEELADANEPASAAVAAFAALGLRNSVLKGIDALGFIDPTDIQRELIPKILAGGDLMGQAKTGTGKTAAFGLPIIHSADPEIPMQAMILVPTRELAAQVASELNTLGKFTPIRATCIVGGESMREQTRSLKRGGHIIVGTPGRVIDMLDRGEINLRELRFIVLDEVDRMLDIGFRDDIRRILKQIQRDHQTIFVSATLDSEIEKLARQFMRPDAEKIVTTGEVLTVALVEQKYVPVEPWDKERMLVHLLKTHNPDTTVVFCRTKMTVHRVAKSLAAKGINAREIHGDLHQSKRNTVMQSLRDRKLSVLVASDLAARGLDIDHITHVVNYDLPDDPEIYIHRIGRTARAGRKGTAWSFVLPDQGELLSDIEKLAGVMLEKLEVEGFKGGSVPPLVVEERNRLAQRADTTPSTAIKARVINPEHEGKTDDQLKAMFPDGNIPKAPPARTLGGRVRPKRGRR